MSTIIDKVQEYLERQSLSAELCRIYLRKIEHLYYKFDPIVLKQKQVIWNSSYLGAYVLKNKAQYCVLCVVQVQII